MEDKWVVQYAGIAVTKDPLEKLIDYDCNHDA